MKEFDEVKLKKGITHHCPEGREDNDNDTAIIITIINGEEVKLNRDLHGCKWWNINDLEAV